ncbi:hypothetical protein BGY98DRAFT_1010068 [Russula aff. rugulosa BPL654]|nr:hypothetical protein BGY98DRAFT_1010068 [Russula aff. rugulosa BPL654]
MPDVEIRFSPEKIAAGSFCLLELPPDLCRSIESSADNLSLMIKLAQKTMQCYAPRTRHITSAQ